jgi:3-oxoacyl-(acyl-carrier-protein) synthase III
MATFLIDIPVPSMGATVNELTVIDLKVRVGDAVTKGGIAAELESDKSVFEWEAPCDGVVRALHCRAGDIIRSGDLFLSLETADESLRHLESKGAPGTPSPSSASAPARVESALRDGSSPAWAGQPPYSPAPAPAPIRPSPANAPIQPAAPALLWTPRALKLAREAGLDPAALVGLAGTGPGGRITGEDFQAWIATRPTAAGTGGAAASLAPSTTLATPPADDTVCIAGVGHAVPKNIRPTSEILKSFPGRTEAEMHKLTGIHERRYAGPDETATSLAATAVKHALAQAGLCAAQIDGIVLATIIPDQPVPSMASALARELGCPKALAFDLNAACSGWLYALEVGRAFIRGGTAKNVVVVTAELLSRITNPNDHETAFLFGDGAGAALLTTAPGGHRLHRMALSGDAAHFEAIQRPGGGAARPWPCADGSDRDDFYLQMDGAAVFKNAVIAFADQIEKTLARHHLRPEDIAWIVPHQANERILRAVGKRVGIPFEKFVVTIAKYGNTSGASVSMALGWAAEEGIFQTGDRIIFCSVGAGLTYAGGLLVW